MKTLVITVFVNAVNCPFFKKWMPRASITHKRNLNRTLLSLGNSYHGFVDDRRIIVSSCPEKRVKFVR
eukprot:Pgem_evm2s3309